MSMDKVTIAIETDDSTRASEIVADLRNVAEALYFPMKMVGFWDYRADMHLCPQEERREICPHRPNPEGIKQVEYSYSMGRERQANLEVYFPHSNVALFLR